MTIQENNSLQVESQIHLIQRLQRGFRSDRAYHAISDYLKFKIEEVSKENLKRLRKDLAEGQNTLAAHCVREAEVETTYWDLFSWIFHKIVGVEQPPEVTRLLPGEIRLMQLIMENLTLKHTTTQSAEEMDELVSIRERMRRGESVENCRTTLHSRDEFVYFTFGIGDHYTYYGNNPDNHEIIIDVNKHLKENPNGLDGMWISGHDSCYINSSVSVPVKLGGTSFRFYHDRKDRTKTYIYERSDGSRFERKVNYKEEVLCGNDVVPGIAMQFIQHLRYIGGSYREHILDTVNSKSEDEDKSLKILSVAMQAIMPGWIYPEAKVPVNVSLKSSAVTKQNNEEVQKKYRYVSDESDLYIAIQTHNRKKLQEYVDAGNDFSIRFTNGKTPLTLAINYQKPFGVTIGKSLRDFEGYPNYVVMRTVQFLVAHGASILDTDSDQMTPLCRAVAAKNYSVVSFLLQREEEDPNDAMIVRAPHANAYNKVHLSPVSQLLSEPKNANTHRILSRLLEFGADVKGWGLNYLLLATMKEGGFMMDSSLSSNIISLLVQYGADASETPESGTSPLICCVANSNYQKEDSLRAAEILIEHGADIDYQFSPPVPSQEAGYTALHVAADLQHEKMVALLLEKGANPNLRSVNKRTPLLIAQQNGSKQIEDILRRHGAHTFDKVESDIIAMHQYCVMVVITGKNKYGDEVVVMGHKRDRDGQINEKLLVPGGYKDFADTTFEYAAIREAEEETNLELSEKYKCGEIRPRLLHSQKMVSDDRENLIKIFCYHIDVGESLANRLVGKDDLIELSARPLKDFDPKAGAFEKKPVRFSNAIVLANLHNEGKEWRKELQEALMIENLGGTMLFKAFKEKNEKEAIRLLQHPSFHDILEEINYKLLLRAFGESLNKKISDLLFTHMSARKYSEYEVEGILKKAALYGHEKLCQWLISTKEFDIDEILTAFCKASKGGHIELALMLHQEATKESRQEEWQNRGDWESSSSSDSDIDSHCDLDGDSDNNHEEVVEQKKTVPPPFEVFLNLMLVSAGSAGRRNVIDYVLSKMTPTKSQLKDLAFELGKNNNAQLIDDVADKFDVGSVERKTIYQQSLLGAVHGVHMDLIEYLLKKGVDVYDFPFHQCPKESWLNPVVQRDKSSWSISLYGCKSPLERMLEKPSPSLLKVLLESHAPGSKVEKFFSRSSLLIKSIFIHEHEIAKVLVEDGRINLDISYKGKTALIHALETNMKKELILRMAETHIKQAISTIVGRTVDIEMSGLKLIIQEELLSSEESKLKEVLGGVIPKELTLEQIEGLLEGRHEQYKDHRYAKIVFDILNK